MVKRIDSYSLKSLQKRIDLITKVIGDYKSGLTYRQIALKHRLNIATIYNMINSNLERKTQND